MTPNFLYIDHLFFSFFEIYIDNNIIPIKLIPIDNPSNKPELNSLKGVASLPQKKV